MSLGSTAYSSPNPFAPSFHTPRNLDDPLQFSLDEQRLNEWYKFHRDAGSTTIQKVQLRKEHKSPFHEFVMVLTKAGYYYRTERGRDRDGTILDTLRENGVPAVDTIARLDLTSLEELDGTSYCAIELCWGSDKTIDLKLVLDICFQIHNKSGPRYKLLTHNCYFFAQTIIMIAVRKTVYCKLDKMFEEVVNVMPHKLLVALLNRRDIQLYSPGWKSLWERMLRGPLKKWEWEGLSQDLDFMFGEQWEGEQQQVAVWEGELRVPVKKWKWLWLRRKPGEGEEGLDRKLDPKGLE